MGQRIKPKTRRLIFFLVIFAVGLIIVISLAVKYLKEKPTIITTGDGLRVKLYYYNKLEDKDRSLRPEFVLPVEKVIPRTKSPIKDTINLLLKGELTWKERSSGFETEFPHPEFKLKSAKLKNGVLTLEFPEVPGFTSGGAGRVGLLAAQIIKTAKQFPQVKTVNFKPEYLFQP